MRSLLDVREQYLNEFSFPDPYAEVSYDVCNPFQSVSTSQSDPCALFAFVDLFSLCFSIIWNCDQICNKTCLCKIKLPMQ